MELSTSTPKTKVRLVERMSSRICRAIVVVLILTVRIVNVNREVAKWLEQQPREGTTETVFSVSLTYQLR